jgi:hypothetical protein
MGARLAESLSLASFSRNRLQRSVNAMSLCVHGGGEHGADLGFGGEEMAVEIRHRRIRDRLSQEEWRYCRGGVTTDFRLDRTDKK